MGGSVIAIHGPECYRYLYSERASLSIECQGRQPILIFLLGAEVYGKNRIKE